MTGSERKITKRACDGCKIRKIKCSGLSPCDGCTAVQISCTYLKHPSTRGPRKLRTRTLQEIAQTQQLQQQELQEQERRHQQHQQQQRHDAERPPPIPAPIGSPQDPPALVASVNVVENDSHSRIPVASLVLHLCVYRLRLFPVWPIARVEEIITRLQRNQEDVENYALATALGAATASQLKLTPASLGGDAVTAEMMEAECRRTRSTIDKATAHSLTAIRIAFLLHIFYENQEAGGVKSLLYLREAITLAQMIGLHKESSYMVLSSEEQQMRRRVLWLLFVTERGVAMLHKLPVVLKVNVAFPSIDRRDETFVLPAFQKLVNLFWIFDQSGAFDILQDSDADIFGLEDIDSPNRTCLDLLQRQLVEIPVENESINDIQTADICVTRQWMRAVLWKFSVNHGLLASISPDQVTSLTYPLQIAKEFLSMISHIPNSAIEAHGQGIELKIYEIASSVTDAIAKSALAGRNPWNSPSSADRPGDILNQLHRILSSCRGGNKTLVSMLCKKIAEVQNGQMLLMQPGNRIIEEEDSSPEQWPAEVSDNLNGQMDFDLGMNLGRMDGQRGFSEQATYREEPAVPDFGENQARDDLSPQSSISSNSNMPLGMPQTSQPSQEQRSSFNPYNLWNIPDPSNSISSSTPGFDRTREGALYSQLQQDFNGAFGISNVEGLNGVDQFSVQNGDIWPDSGMGLGIEDLGTGPEAVEQWN